MILRLKEIMTEKGVSRDELAKRLGVTPATISNLSTGKSYPTISTLLLIAEVLDVDVRDLFNPTKTQDENSTDITRATELIQRGLDILRQSN